MVDELDSDRSTGNGTAPRWSRELFIGYDPTPSAEIVAYRKAPSRYACELPVYIHPGGHILRVLGMTYGDGTYQVSLRDRVAGKGRRRGFVQGGGEVTLSGFGPSRLPQATPEADRPEDDAPMPHRSMRGHSEPMVQTLPEAVEFGAGAGDPRMLHFTTQLGQVVEQNRTMAEAVRGILDQRNESVQERRYEGLQQAIDRQTAAIEKQTQVQLQIVARQDKFEVEQTKLRELVEQSQRGTPIVMVEQAKQLAEKYPGLIGKGHAGADQDDDEERPRRRARGWIPDLLELLIENPEATSQIVQTIKGLAGGAGGAGGQAIDAAMLQQAIAQMDPGVLAQLVAQIDPAVFLRAQAARAPAPRPGPEPAAPRPAAQRVPFVNPRHAARQAAQAAQAAPGTNGDGRPHPTHNGTEGA